MTLEECKANEGKFVMSRDAGRKLVGQAEKHHGPYLLRKVTKGGRVIIARWENGDMSVPPSLLSPLLDCGGLTK